MDIQMRLVHDTIVSHDHYCKFYPFILKAASFIKSLVYAQSKKKNPFYSLFVRKINFSKLLIFIYLFIYLSLFIFFYF